VDFGVRDLFILIFRIYFDLLYFINLLIRYYGDSAPEPTVSRFSFEFSLGFSYFSLG
jgi:hypothetical protein